MNRLAKYISVVAAFAVLILTGCTERDLEYRDRAGGLINLAINWVNGPVPTGAVIILYPVDGGENIILNTPAAGYSGPLPAGEYNVIAYSTEQYNLGFRNMDSFSQGQVYTIPNGTKLTQPGYISMGNSIVNKNILVVPQNGTVNETINAYQLTHTFTITFIMDNTASGVSAISGQLLGVSPYVQCSTLIASTDRYPVDYTSIPGQTSDRRVATITALGYTLSPGSGDITMQIVQGGSTYYSMLDLTQQLQDIITANGGKLPLHIDITIRIALGLDGIQMTATATDWKGGDSGNGVVE